MWRKVVARREHVIRFLLPLGLLCGTATGGICQSQMSIAIRDAQSDNPIDVRVAAEYGSDQLEFQQKQPGTYASTIALKPRASSLRFNLVPNISYAPRKIELNGTIAKKNNYQFYLSKKLPTYTYGYLDRCLDLLAQEDFDRAVAALEVAYAASGLGKSKTQFDVKLKFNFARSLANACQILGYNSCVTAKALYTELKEEMSGNPKLFTAEGISIQTLEKTLRDLDATKVTRQYATFRDAFGQGDYAEAASLGEGMLNQFDSDVAAFSEARLTKDRLREDVGTAYARTALSSDKSGSQVLDTENAKKALDHFQAISGKSSIVSRNISDLEKRM